MFIVATTTAVDIFVSFLNPQPNLLTAFSELSYNTIIVQMFFFGNTAIAQNVLFHHFCKHTNDLIRMKQIAL
jgi:hypothetical protein